MKRKHFSKSESGFTLVEIMIVVAIIALLAAIAIPNFVRARVSAQTDACINNLRQLDGATQRWALENNKSASSAVTSGNILPYLGHAAGDWPVCPAGGTYSVTTVNAPPTCSVSGHTL